MVSPASGDFTLAMPAANIKWFPFNWFPQRVGTFLDFSRSPILNAVRFPFNWFPRRVGTNDLKQIAAYYSIGFHSIGFPSEWGQQFEQWLDSIEVEFPFNWFPQRVGTCPCSSLTQKCHSFHSIGFPSEWGHFPPDALLHDQIVSIQLVSPASGDNSTHIHLTSACQVSINWLPQRVGT